MTIVVNWPSFVVVGDVRVLGFWLGVWMLIGVVMLVCAWTWIHRMEVRHSWLTWKEQHGGLSGQEFEEWNWLFLARRGGK